MVRNRLLIVLFCSLTVGLFAQKKHEKPKPVREDFCLILDKIFEQEVKGFPNVADTATEEEQASGHLPVKENYGFDQASCELVKLPSGQTVYRAVFMTRDDKESLVASYNNLLAMVKECYGKDYVFKDKTSKIRKIYECRGAPYDINVNKEQAEVVVYIQEDWMNRIYRLVLQVD
jgi:hypothetical protein